MGFTERNFQLGPDLVGQEDMANGDTLHTLGMYSTTEDLRFQVQAHKRVGEDPYYAFSWPTTIEDAAEAAELFENADKLEGLDARAGTFMIRGEGGNFEFDWLAEAPEDKGDVVDAADFGVNMAGLIRIDTEKAALGWTRPSELDPGYRIGLITSEDIASGWIHEFFDKTATDEAKMVVSRNMGRMAVMLTQFMETPFGEPLQLVEAG